MYLCVGDVEWPHFNLFHILPPRVEKEFCSKFYTFSSKGTRRAGEGGRW